MPGELLLTLAAVVLVGLLLLAGLIGYGINKIAPKDPLALAGEKNSIAEAVVEAISRFRSGRPGSISCARCLSVITVTSVTSEKSKTGRELHTACNCKACNGKYILANDA